ncbi:MAG: serine/threonine-protein kinase [Planctomycetota bacterium]
MSESPTPEQWQRIESVFQKVVELPAEQREQRLLALTKDDNALRQEVESLLSHDDEQSLDLTAGALSGSGISSASRKPGQIVGGYRLSHPLAVNRASEVWCAEPVGEVPIASIDPQREQRVAIKFLRAGPNDQRRLDRFRNEVVFLSRFRHPGIAELLHAGNDQSCPYFVMRFIPGIDIIRFANRHRLTTFERIDLAIQLCEAVQYAHRHLVVHRDLKPSNVLVTKDHVVTVLDFGISKYAGEVDSELLADGLTATRERPMTLAYGSPEQLRGESITFATDLHALGLILFELLTGHHPYSDSACREQVPGTELPPLFDRVCTHLPAASSQVVLRRVKPIDDIQSSPERSGSGDRSPDEVATDRRTTSRQLNRVLRDHFDGVIERCLAKRPTDRFKSASELRDALQLAKLRSIESTGDGKWQRIVRRNPIGVTVATALVAAAFGVGVMSWVQTNSESGRNTPPRPVVVEKSTESDDTLPWAQWVTELVQTQSEDVTLANHESLLSALPPETRAALAGHAADNRRDKLARLLVKTFADENEPYPESGVRRWDLARAASFVSLPTVAVRALRDELEPTLQEEDPDWYSVVTTNDTTIGSAKTLVRTLLELELHTAAFECSDDRKLPGREDLEFLLLAAEARVAIGWREGATEPLASLRERSEDLTPQQLDRLQFWEAMSMEEVAQRLQKLHPWIDVADRDEWEDAVLQASALRAAARIEIEFDDRATARGLLQRARELVRRVGGQGTSIEARINRDLCQLLLSNDEIDHAQTVLSESWDGLRETDELSSSGAVYVALRHFDFTRQPQADQILGRLEAYRFIHQLFPYDYRELLHAKGQAAIAVADWERAKRAYTPLVELEEELWSEDASPIARAHAWLALVNRRLGREKEATQSTERVRRYARLRLREAELKPVRGFLLPILEIEPDKSPHPNHIWLEKFEHHQDNSLDVQAEMIRYEIRQIERDHPDVASLLRSVLEEPSQSSAP